MPGVKIVHVKKGQDYLSCVLGLHILRLLKAGYKKYEIKDLGDVIEIRTWRIRKRKEGESGE